MKLSILIVNYNVTQLLRNCLNSIQQYVQNIDYEIVVVDNQSPDSSWKDLINEFPSVKFIENSANEGFAKANNKAAKIANGGYILLLNPDTELEGKEISPELLEYIHVNKTGALLKLCVRMGAILAEASEKDLEKLTTYAEKIGLAFQIKDDILSEEGNPDVTGKPVGNDKEHNKCTYVSVFGIEGAKKELEKITNEAVEILEYYGDKAEFLKQLAIYIKDRNK